MFLYFPVYRIGKIRLRMFLGTWCPALEELACVVMETDEGEAHVENSSIHSGLAVERRVFCKCLLSPHRLHGG